MTASTRDAPVALVPAALALVHEGATAGDPVRRGGSAARAHARGAAPRPTSGARPRPRGAIVGRGTVVRPDLPWTHGTQRGDHRRRRGGPRGPRAAADRPPVHHRT